MLSVAESAKILKVSPARVRALIAQGTLPARKVGRAWILHEEDLMQRLSTHPHSGRPPATHTQLAKTSYLLNNGNSSCGHNNNGDQSTFDSLYEACKEAFQYSPSAQDIIALDDPEKAAFCIAVADFFLQRTQNELIQQGVY